MQTVSYSREFADVRLIDILPPSAAANGRAILFIHGGGWQGGSKESWHKVMAHFAGLGYVTFSATYHRAPAFRFPRQAEDVRTAMAWVKGQAATYGFDPCKIATWGSSAGAHLVDLLATIRPGDILGRGPEVSEAPDTLPAATVSLCGVHTCFHYMAKDNVAKMLLQFLGTTEHEQPELVRAASPLERLTGQEAPFLFITGDADETTPLKLTEEMHERLLAKGVSSTLHVLPGVGHGFGYGNSTPAQLRTLELASAWLAEVLK